MMDLGNLSLVGKPGKVVLILSPCRSGSTALLNALSMAEGYDGLYQPIKSAVRCRLSADPTRIVMRARARRVLVIKETLGYNEPEEVYFDPIGALLGKGIDPSTLFVIPLLRDPNACFASWMHTYSQFHVDLRLFAAAYQVIHDDCEKYARAAGVRVLPLHYEELVRRDRLQYLLEHQLGMPFHASMWDWQLSSKPLKNGFAFHEFHQPLPRHGTAGDVPNRNGFCVVANDSPDLTIPQEIAMKFSTADVVEQIRIATVIYSSMERSASGSMH